MMSESTGTEVATVTDEIVPGGEQVPLGVGNFEDVMHDPLAGAESKRRIDTGSLLIFGVVIVSIGGLVAMRGLAGDEEINAGNTHVDETINKFIDSQKTGAAKGPVVALFPEEYLGQQVPLENVQKNPFVLFENKEPEVEQGPDPEDPAEIFKRQREARIKVIEQAGTRIRLAMVLMGRTPLANINDTIMRVGETLMIEPEQVTFRVTDIRDDGITLISEDVDYDIVYEVVIALHKE